MTSNNKDREIHTSAWYDTADIDFVYKLLTDSGAESVWVKHLSANHNSKQQIWLATDLSDLSFLPLGIPSYTQAKSQKKTRKRGFVIQVPLAWNWVTPSGIYSAPQAKLCYYPQYPEVRFSGFLQGCKEPPSELMSDTKRGHEAGRCLFFGPVKSGNKIKHVVGLVTGKKSKASQYVRQMETYQPGHLCPVMLKHKNKPNDFSVLEQALINIIGKKIIPWRLLNDGSSDRPYTAPNAAGLTLEAELGVGENAIPGPDFDIWELKAVKQKTLDSRKNHKITLFTPQPDKGWITEHTQVDFVLKYGHISKIDDNGNATEYYFTTKDINRFGEKKIGAKLTLKLEGFIDETNFNPSGMIALIDDSTGELAAGWSYLKLLDHWQRKHNRVAYVPYIREDREEETFVEFGPLITLGLSTGFGKFLQAFKDGKAVYDPGDKAVLKNDKWTPHSRSQFRINLNDINAIYQEVKEIDIRNSQGS